MALHVYVDNPFIWINFKGVDNDRNRVVFYGELKPDVNLPSAPVHAGSANAYTIEKAKQQRELNKFSMYSTVKEFETFLQHYIDTYGTLDIENNTEYIGAVFMSSENCRRNASWEDINHNILAIRYKVGSRIGSAECSRGTISFKRGNPVVSAEPFVRKPYIFAMTSLMGTGRLISLC